MKTYVKPDNVKPINQQIVEKVAETISGFFFFFFFFFFETVKSKMIMSLVEKREIISFNFTDKSLQSR